MGKSITGVLLVLGGALAGAVASGVYFALVFAVLGHPNVGEGAGVFGLTFGLIGGVGLAFAAMDNVIDEKDYATLALPIIVGLLLAGLAIAVLLFGDRSWSKMFPGGGVAILVPWVLIGGWVGNMVGKKS